MFAAVAMLATGLLVNFFHAAPHAHAHVRPGGTIAAAAAAALATGSGHVLYVATVPPGGPGTLGNVDIYALEPARTPKRGGAMRTLVGELTNLDSPTGLAMDARGDLYVCQTDFGAPVLVYAPGATQPSAKLDVGNALPSGAIAVAANGEVFVATVPGPELRGGILVYGRGATKPRMLLTGPFGMGIARLAIDSAENLYVDYVDDAYQPHVGEFPSGSNTPIADLGFGGSPIDMLLDGRGDLALFQALPRATWIGIYPPNSTTPVAQIRTPFAQAMAIDRYQSVLYLAAGSIRLVTYPEGRTIAIIPGHSGDNTFGVAVWPQAPTPRAWSRGV